MTSLAIFVILEVFHFMASITIIVTFLSVICIIYRIMRVVIVCIWYRNFHLSLAPRRLLYLLQSVLCQPIQHPQQSTIPALRVFLDRTAAVVQVAVLVLLRSCFRQLTRNMKHLSVESRSKTTYGKAMKPVLPPVPGTPSRKYGTRSRPSLN